jgi:hypothetical protein
MTRFVSKLAISLALLAGLTGLTRAQDNTTEHDVIRPITASGSAAFMFTLQGLGTFGIGAPSVNGMMSGVGAKWYVANDIALRVLLGLGSNQVAGTGIDSATTLTSTSFGIGVGGEYHFRPLYSTSPYVGLQVGFTSTSTDVPEESGTATDKTTSFGVTALAGFDWFFTRGLAVGAEMGLGFVSNGGTTVTGASKPSTSNINLATDGNVHFLVYF